MSGEEATLKNRPKRGSMPYIPLDDDEKQEWVRFKCETERWFRAFEKKIRVFLDSRKMAAWIQKNVADYKELDPVVILQDFIEKEVLGVE